MAPDGIEGVEPAAAVQPVRSPPIAIPSVSVVITNRDYGHFLDDCIESVISQARPAAEIIVVDDGSRDMSAEVLARHAGRIDVVQTGGRGQAAAFNAGFRASSGDTVVFLDADDLLRPEAVEMIEAYWYDGLVLLSFGLERIDAGGRSLGLHDLSIQADEGDNRPKILRAGALSGTFVFAPTSGNVFGRRFLTAIMPMPEEEWRICADAYLVRGAALHGRVRAVRRVLSGYRVHGGNHYIRHDTFDLWSMGRGARDLEIKARALESLAEHGTPRGPEEAATRLALRLRAFELWGQIAVWSRDFSAFRRQTGSMLRAVWGGRLPLGERLTGLAGVGRFACAVETTPPLADPAQGDGPVSVSVGSRLGGSQLADRLAALQKLRYHYELPLDTEMQFNARSESRTMLADGWFGVGEEGVCWSLNGKAALEFSLPPTPGAVQFQIGLVAEEGRHSEPIRISIAANGQRIWSQDVLGEGDATFAVDRDPLAGRELIRLEVSATRTRRRPFRPGAVAFGVSRLRAERKVSDLAAPVLRAGEVVETMLAVLPDPEACGWRLRPDGVAEMLGGAAKLPLLLDPGVRRGELILCIGPGAAEGWLSISEQGRNLYSGEVSGGDVVHVPLVVAEEGEVEGHELVLAFTSGNGGDDPFALARLGVIATTSEAGPIAEQSIKRVARALLTPGETLFIGANPEAERVLQFGWGDVASAGVRNIASEAGLVFGVLGDDGAPVAHLVLRAVLPELPDRRLIVGASVEGVMRQVVELRGEGVLTVPLPPARQSGDQYRITLHAFFSADGIDLGNGIATVELVSLKVDGVSPRTPALVSANGFARPHFVDLVERALAAKHGRVPLDELLALRSDVSRTVLALEPRALRTLAANASWLDGLAWLGEQTVGAPMGSKDMKLVDMIGTCGVEGAPAGDRLRAFLAAMPMIPAHRLEVASDLARMPAILLSHPDVMVSYLAGEPRYVEQGERRGYVEYLERLLENVHHLLASEASGTALHDFASRALMGLRNTTTLFTSEDLVRQIRLRSSAIERLLVQSGARLAQRVVARPNATSLRMAVLTRSLAPTPEGWAAIAMHRGIDQERFEVTLVTTDDVSDDPTASEHFDSHLKLEGMAVDEAVAAIRSRDFDVLVLGAYIANWERLTAIVAHRLARLQISLCFNNPTTLGFDSFDHAIAWRGAGDAQDQHTERLVTTDLDLQCCFDFRGLAEADSEDQAAVRRRFGLPEAGTIFVSGAMAYKIQSEAMAAWADILARAQGSHLVLYPFARVWAMGQTPEIFRRRLDCHLRQRGVDASRVTVLPEQSSAEVWRLLRASDVYLDSFPYSGATTVCEALACECPVVALEGGLLRQRTGSAWLKLFGLANLVADSASDYVEIAISLARDHDARSESVARIREGSRPVAPYSDHQSFGRAYSDCVWRIAMGSGLFPDLASEPGRRRSGGLPVVVPQRRLRDGLRAAEELEHFVVLATPRTGSTLLCDTLTSAENMLVDYELFHQSRIQYGGGEVVDPEAIAARDADPIRWLRDREEAAARFGYTMSGFKLFPFHDRRIMDHVMKDRRYKIILLVRENRLAQYSSGRIASKTGQWVLKEGQKRVGAKLEFDPEDFERYELWLKQVHASFMDGVESHGRSVLFLEYAELRDRATPRRLSQWLSRDVTFEKRLTTIRQNSARIAGRFDDSERVIAYLEGRGLGRWAEEGARETLPRTA